MGFLDRIVADFISNATGLPVKGLIRKVGAKKLLLGGAALAAGGLAVAKMQESKTSTPATPPPPSLPPIPGAAAPPLPPLPPAPVTPDTEAGDDLDPDLTAAIVRTMIAAALADGHLAPSERESIQSHLKDSGLSPEQISDAHADLLSPASPTTLAALAREDSDREVLYRTAILIMMADKEFAETERSWLDEFAQHLDLDDAQKAAIEHDLIS